MVRDSTKGVFLGTEPASAKSKNGAGCLHELQVLGRHVGRRQDPMQEWSVISGPTLLPSKFPKPRGAGRAKRGCPNAEVGKNGQLDKRKRVWSQEPWGVGYLVGGKPGEDSGFTL